MSGATFQMACNRAAQPCGCTSWDQLEDGEWVRKTWRCSRCETADAIEWLDSEKGEAWSRRRHQHSYFTGGPSPSMGGEPGPVDPAEDPTGRPALNVETAPAEGAA